MKQTTPLTLKRILKGRVLLNERSMRPGAAPNRKACGKREMARHDARRGACSASDMTGMVPVSLRYRSEGAIVAHATSVTERGYGTWLQDATRLAPGTKRMQWAKSTGLANKATWASRPKGGEYQQQRLGQTPAWSFSHNKKQWGSSLTFKPHYFSKINRMQEN